MLSKTLRQIDWLIIAPTTYLLAISLVVLKSVELSVRIPIDFSFNTQLVAILIGAVLMMQAVKLRDSWFRLAGPLYAAAVILLIVVLLSGTVRGGATRWIDIGSIQLQPSELAKFALILVQAKLLSARAAWLHRPWPLLLSAGYVALVSALVLAQPDLGTVVVIISSWLCMLGISRIPKRTLLLVISLLLLTIPAVYPFLPDYQQQRIESFFNPTLDTRGEGYNVLQASIALGSGGLVGKGLDAGSQSQLNFLPAQHTDFIFAVIGEKLGFVGCISVVLAFVVLLIRIVSIGWRAPSAYFRFLGIGVAAMIGIQFIINVGMNVGLLPVTGVPLPFVSAGGSHIIVEMAMLSLVLGVKRRTG